MGSADGYPSDPCPKSGRIEELWQSEMRIGKGVLYGIVHVFVPSEHAVQGSGHVPHVPSVERRKGTLLPTLGSGDQRGIVLDGG